LLASQEYWNYQDELGIEDSVCKGSWMAENRNSWE